MKKGKVFGKKQIILAAMVLALGGAVWLNMKYSSPSTVSDKAVDTASYLGEATYVDNTSAGEAVETGAKAADYFEKMRNERNKTRSEAIDELEETAADAQIEESVKTAAVERIATLTSRMDTESSIETLLKTKGFTSVLAVIGDNDINVAVKCETLTESETVQIGDIATSQSGLTLDKVKIITVK